jgi:hypothetical protein
MPKRKDREGEKKPDKQKAKTKPVLQAHNESLPDPQLNVSLRPLLAYLERAQRRGEMETVLKGLRQLVADRGDVQLGIQSSDWLALLAVFGGLAICSGTTYTVTGSVSAAAAGASAGASITGGIVTVAFNVAGGTVTCPISPTAVSITNVTQGGPAVFAGYATKILGFYTATAPVPATWASGDQLDVTVTLATSSKTWCDTCLLAAATATYTVFVI